MPHYESFCHNCKKLFSKVLSLADCEEGEVLCPALRRPGSGAALVRLLHHHLQEERVTTPT